MTDFEPGWYPDGTGVQRYWDGTQWTEHTAPLAEVEVQETAVEEAVESTPSDTVATSSDVVDNAFSQQSVDTALQQQEATYGIDAQAAYGANAQAAYGTDTQAAYGTNGQAAYGTNGQAGYGTNGQAGYAGMNQQTVATVPGQTTVNVQVGQMGRANLDTNRSLVKFILIGFITLGIYQLFITARAGEDLNMMASRWDGKRTMNYWLIALLLGPITLGIMYLIWWNGFANRIGAEQQRRGLPKTVSASDFWLWSILGSLIIVGPFIFAYKWLGAMNQLCENYNTFG